MYKEIGLYWIVREWCKEILSLTDDHDCNILQEHLRKQERVAHQSGCWH